MNVAVIGAGLQGIQALRQLSKHAEIHNVIAFERRDVLGGLWAYSAETGPDENGLHVYPSMYRDCMTLGPSESIQFWDLPLKDAPAPGSFMHWSQVLSYLNYYVDHFHLRKCIKLNTLVERVHPEVQENGAVKWDVQVRQVDKPDAVTETHYFDAVFVCNGAFCVPRIPEWPGLSAFVGLVIHSYEYRVADPFRNMRVMVVGGGPSGVDIGIDISKIAKQVYLSTGNTALNENTIFPENMKLVKPIKEFKPRSVVLTDNQELSVDAILLTTGYQYSFPFLSNKCHPQIEQTRIFPLYKHVVHVDFPTLFILGICKSSFFFLLDFLLAEVAVSMLLGKLPLPSRDEMLQDIHDDYKKRKAMGMREFEMHSFFPANAILKPYQASIVKLLKVPDSLTLIPQVWFDHLDNMFRAMFANPRDYKSRRYPIDKNWDQCKL